MREQMSSQGLQSHVGRWEVCLPASLPASLSLPKKPIMYKVSYCVHFLDFTGTFEGTRQVHCVQCLTVLRRGPTEAAAGPSQAPGAFGLFMTGLGAAE